MGLTLVGDIATLQTQFETIKEEVDKQFDKTILNLEETSWAIIRKKRDFLLRTTDWTCLLYTSPSPRDRTRSRMPSSA